MNKQASASLPPSFCIVLCKGTLSFSFLVLFFCTEVSETCFFNSIEIFTEVTEKNLPQFHLHFSLLQFCSVPQPMLSSLTEVTLSEHTFVVQTGFEPCGSHAEGRDCFVEMARLLEETPCYRQH